MSPQDLVTEEITDADDAVTDELIEAADLIEEVSIDGMCGVY
jgi:mycofactocin precursor